LVQLTSNLGAVDQASLIAGAATYPKSNPDGTFDLVRIGDALAARNIHAALLDAIRATVGF
ncbi:MAG: hypothetical protein AAFN51_05545, partial [Pseudomonadota bacterium]